MRWQRRRATLARLRSEWGKPKARSRNLRAIGDYHRSQIADGESSRSLDARTWEDLNLDAVFAALDRAESVVGQQLLYHRLHALPLGAYLDPFDDLATLLESDATTRERAQLSLSRLQSADGYDLWWLVQPGVLSRPRWQAIFAIIAAGVLMSLVMAAFSPGLLIVTGCATVLNLGIRIVTGRRLGITIGAFRQVGPLISAAQELAAIDALAGSPLATALRRDVSALVRLGRYAGVVSRDRAAAAAGDPAAIILEYLNLLFLLDLNALYFASREIAARGHLLLNVIAAVGEIDAAISIASFRAGSRTWTRPAFRSPDEPATFENATHPLVHEPVPNSIELTPTRGVLITGSNMSGKTTFLRTLGVNVILAQTVKTCLATGYAAPILRVRSCIGRSDDLVEGKSYYVAEVEAVLSLVRASASTDPYLFLFDELFRGTNAVERIAAAEAILQHLANAGGHRIVAATHDGELVDMLADRYRSCHFVDRLGAHGLEFAYRLAEGPATTRNAIALLQLHGAPSDVVAHATERALALDRQRMRGTSSVT